MRRVLFVGFFRVWSTIWSHSSSPVSRPSSDFAFHVTSANPDHVLTLVAISFIISEFPHVIDTTGAAKKPGEFLQNVLSAHEVLARRWAAKDIVNIRSRPDRCLSSPVIYHI
ncbi:hypothetical protein BDP27DRAFT_1334519, partial [Rhodocollybia butyracea]